MKRTVFGTKSWAIIIYLVWNCPKKKTSLSTFGQRHLRYIKQSKCVFYTNLLTSYKLNSYLADIDEQAEDMFSRLVKGMTKIQGVTEHLKENNQMVWVGKINTVRKAATKIVNK